MTPAPSDAEEPTDTTDDRLADEIRANILEMTATLSALDVDSVEVALPYRAAWTETEATR